MPDVTQSRSLPHYEIPFFFKESNGGADTVGSYTGLPTTQTTTSFRSSKNDELTDSVLEAAGKDGARGYYRELIRDYQTRFDNGHSFFTEKSEYTISSPEIVTMKTPFAAGNQTTYSGFLIPRVQEFDRPTFGTLQSFPNPDVNQVGRLAIAATIPTAPEAALATFLGELRQRLPQLPLLESVTKRHLNLSSEYLTYEFDTKPLIADLTSFAHSIKNAAKLARQYTSGSGKSIRRKRVLREEKIYDDQGLRNPGNQSIQMGAKTYGSVESEFFSNPARGVYLWDEYFQREWFSGAYTYHVSEAHSFLGKLESYEQLANHLLGTRLTLSTIWELAPWSWLSDWFFDSGTFVKNLTSLTNDSLVLRYGYIMRTNSVERNRLVTGLAPKPGGSVPERCHTKYLTVQKTRTKATPYGFGLNPNSFSIRQWAILGALGMTRSPNSIMTSQGP